MNPTIELSVFAETDIGQSRAVNQDRVFAWASPLAKENRLALLLVADGMGGHQAGEVASKLAVETISTLLLPRLEQDLAQSPESLAELERILREAIEEASAEIRRYAETQLDAANGMGTTIAAALIQGDQAIIAHVGDSRIYLLGQAGLEQLTRDHTAVSELVAEGLLDAEDILDHPQRHILSQALGASPWIEIDTRVIPIRPGDWLLLCSDGLWSMVRDITSIEQILGRAGSPEEAVWALIEAANQHGGEDNIGIAIGQIKAVWP